MIRLRVLILVFISTVFVLGQEEDFNELRKLSLEELMNVKIVSSTKQDQKITEAPSIIEVITSAQIKNNGISTVAEALQLIPGFLITDNLVTYNVGVRGIIGGSNASSRILKVMINGQPISYRATSENFLGDDLIPISLVHQIEVIRGPSSALYGANAYLGVINIITKNSDQLGKLSLTYSNNIINGNISAGGLQVISGGKLIKDKINYTIALNVKKIDRSGLKLQSSTEALDWEINKGYLEGIYQTSLFDSKTKNDLSKPFSVFSNLDIKTASGKFTTTFHFQKLDNNAKFGSTNPVLNTSRINLYNMFLREEYSNDFFNNKYSLKLSLSYSNGKLLDDYILDINHPEDPNSFLIERNQGYQGYDINAELKYNHSEKLNFLVGSDISIDEQDLSSYRKINNNTGEKLNWINTVGDNNFSNVGVYLQSILKINNKGSITAGIRYDNHSVYGNEFNFRIGSVYRFSEFINVKALFGTSFLAPSAYQLYSPNPPYAPRNGLVSNPDLQPERARTFEISFGINPVKEILLQINGFLNNINDFIIAERRGGISEQKNQDEIKSRGLEFSATAKFDQLYCRFNLSYQKTDRIDRNGIKENINMFPDIIMNLNLNYAFKYFNINANYHFVNHILASQNNIENNLVFGKITKYTIEKYGVVSVTLSSDKIKYFGGSGTELSFTINNLLNENYQYPCFNNYDIPALGRNYKLQITQNF